MHMSIGGRKRSGRESREARANGDYGEEPSEITRVRQISSALPRLEQLHGIPGRVLENHLSSALPLNDLASKQSSRRPAIGDHSIKIVRLDLKTVPSPWHRLAARGARPAETGLVDEQTQTAA